MRASVLDYGRKFVQFERVVGQKFGSGKAGLVLSSQGIFRNIYSPKAKFWIGKHLLKLVLGLQTLSSN